MSNITESIILDKIAAALFQSKPKDRFSQVLASEEVGNLGMGAIQDAGIHLTSGEIAEVIKVASAALNQIVHQS